MKYWQPFGVTNPNAGYENGNEVLGIEGSIPPAQAIEHPQREIIAAIQAAGLALDAANTGQLAQAIAIKAEAVFRSSPVYIAEAVGSGQTIPHNVATNVTSYTTVTENLPNSTLVNGVFTCGAGDEGIYLIVFAFRWASSAVSSNVFANIILSGGAIAFAQDFDPTADVSGGVNLFAATRLNAGQTIHGQILQANTGSATRTFSSIHLKLIRLGA